VAGDVAAVDVEGRARDEAVGRQQQGRGRDLLRLADAPEQVQPGHAVGVVDAVPGVQRRADDPRRDRVDADVVGAEFGGELDGQGVDGALAGQRGGGRHPGDRMIDQHRPDVDDRAAGRLHVRDDRLGEEEGALEIDVEEPVEVLLVDVEKRARLEQAGVVDQHIDAAEPGDGVSDHRLAHGRVGRVGGAKCSLR